MISRMQTRFGTAGLAVAIIALIAALAGGAYAASGALTGKQKKEVQKISKKFAGEDGAAGAQGPAGAAGKDGAAGAQGPAGKDGTNGTAGTNGKNIEVGTATNTPVTGECPDVGGATVQVAGEPSTKKKVCNGTSGFTETLPEGKTETGVWGTGIATESTAGIRYFPISFAIPTSAAPTVVFVGPTEASKPNCPGRGTEPIGRPQAAPGFLCVYASLFEEVNANPAFRVPTFASGEGASAGGSGLTGTLMRVLCESEECQAMGVWAVTGPEE